MSHYGMLFPEFWGGETGRRIAVEGGAAAQVVALYLTANRSATMIGLYPISVAVIQADIRSLSTDQIVGALGVLQRTDFARYDEPTEVIWVLEMARIRLQLAIGESLKDGDRRVTTVQRLYDRCLPNPFLGPFHEKYRKNLRLGKRRKFDGAWKPLLASVHAPLHGASDGASYAPTSPVTGTVTEAGTGIRGQENHQEDQDPASLRVADVRRHLLAAGHSYIEASPFSDELDLREELKSTAARLGVTYSSSDLQPIVDELLQTRQRRGQKVPA